METHPRDPSRSSVEFDESNVTRECGVESESDLFTTRHRGPAKKRVLVVDDCEERLLAVKRALESENRGGFQDLVVELARSGDECLDIVRGVVYGSRTMRTAPGVVLISQDLGVERGVTGRGTEAEEEDDEDYRRDEQQKVGAKGVMSGVECCAEIRRHGELSCVGEQFLHVVLLTDDRPEYVFDREELDFLENGALFSNESEEFTSSRSSRGSIWDSASSDEAKNTWTLAYKNAGVTKTLPNILLDAELLAAVKHMLSHLPVVNH